MSDYTKPVYAIDGREFKSVDGLCRYLSKKHAAKGGVSCFDANRNIRVYADKTTVLATYVSTKPEIGKPMTLTLVAA